MDQATQAKPKETLDLREIGGAKNGVRQSLDRRLFMQLWVWTGCRDAGELAAALREDGTAGALYLDLNDPQGVGLLSIAEDPGQFVEGRRAALNRPAFASMKLKPEFTMLGRTYALGYEPDLEDWLLHKPRRAVLDPNWPWAVWYPLRRTGAFSRLTHEEQMGLLKEHGTIGRRFGDAGYIRDLRLACHGLGPRDNDFVIGLSGRDLHPLSAIVQAMRVTRHTSQYIESMGPFFVGKALWQSPLT